MNRKWNVTNDVAQKKCIDEVIARIKEMDDEPVGMIAAQDIIDIVTENLGADIYNRGVADAKKLFLEKFNDLEIDLEILERNTK